MGFFLTNPFDVKSSDLLQPNLGHPLARGLRIAAIMQPGFPLWTRTGILKPNTIINTVFKGGRYESTNGHLWYDPPAWILAGLTNCTLFYRYIPRATGTNDGGGFNLHDNPQSSKRFGILCYREDIYFTADSTAGRNITVNNVLTAGETYNLATVYNGNNSPSSTRLWGFLNKTKYTTGTQDFPLSLFTDYDRMYIGAFGSGSSVLDNDSGTEVAYAWDRTLTDAEILEISDNPYQIYERSIWVSTAPPGIIELNIDGLNHARSVDQVDLSILATVIPIDSLRHSRAVDSLNLSISVDLFIAGLRHDRRVDAVDIDVSVSLVIDALRHGRFVDIVDIQELVGVLLTIGTLRHARPIDGLLLGIDQSIVIDNMRHGRPVDAAGVQPLLGDQTGIGATATQWILDAGQPLNNAALVDFDYHVLEGVFDSDQSVLGIDGTRVTGPAGMRELTALTLGANVDGQERVQGEIAECRIYAGALSQADRDRILQELQQKWITG